MANNIHCKL